MSRAGDARHRCSRLPRAHPPADVWPFHVPLVHAPARVRRMIHTYLHTFIHSYTDINIQGCARLREGGRASRGRPRASSPSEAGDTAASTLTPFFPHRNLDRAAGHVWSGTRSTASRSVQHASSPAPPVVRPCVRLAHGAWDVAHAHVACQSNKWGGRDVHTG